MVIKDIDQNRLENPETVSKPSLAGEHRRGDMGVPIEGAMLAEAGQQSRLPVALFQPPLDEVAHRVAQTAERGGVGEVKMDQVIHRCRGAPLMPGLREIMAA
jgi:hypothetical protein